MSPQPPTVPTKGPPLLIYPTTALSEAVNVTENGKARKPPVKLEDCKLMELTQYTCDIKGRGKNAEVWCRPVVRLFRRCADGLTVETTEWEWLEKR